MLPQVELAFEPEIRTLWVTLKPEPKPVFTLQVISSVKKVQEAIIRLWGDAAECPVLFFAYRGVGPLFSLGGDLDYYLDCLAENNSEGLRDYATQAAEVIALQLQRLARTVLSPLRPFTGRRSAEVSIRREPAMCWSAKSRPMFGYPEIHYNHFPISAVPILSRHVGID